VEVGIVSTREADTDSVEASGEPLNEWLISSDSHIIEPPTLWTERLPAHLRDRGPTVRREEDADFWYTDGYRTASFHGSEAGARFEKSASELKGKATFEDCRPQSHEPKGYLEDNATDGVWASVIYPTFGLTLFQIPDTDLVSAIMDAYNQWLAEFCREDPSRLKGIAMVNVDDPADGAKQLQRARDLGLSGAIITVTPPEWAPFDSDLFDPFWAAAQDLAMPVSLHVGTMRADARKGKAGFDEVRRFATAPEMVINRDFRVRESIARMIFSGVFER
jgi:Amidohydrolase